VPARTAHSRAWIAPVVLVGVAIVLRIGALVVQRQLNFDDGCYGVSVVDMRHGLLPYRDLFSSQGPLHYPLLYAGDLLSGHFRNGPRVVPILAGVVTPIAVWAIARRLGAQLWPAFLLALIVAATGSMLWATGPVTGDGPAIAFTMGAVWVAVVHRDRPAWWRPLLAGALFGAGVATKLLVLPAALPIAWWCWGRRRRFADVVVAGVTTVVVWLAAALPWGLGRVWDQSIAFHLHKQANGSPLSQLGKLVSRTVGADIELVAVVLLAVIAAIFVRRVFGSDPTDVRVVAAWVAIILVVLLSQKALYQQHFATLIPPLAVLLALRPPPLRWLVIAMIALVPIQIYQDSDIVWPHQYDGIEAQLIARLRALPRDSKVISDTQGFIWQSGHTTPRLLNDNSYPRIYEHLISTKTVTDAAAAPDTCAVVIWSFRFSQHLPGLRPALAREGYRATVYGPNQELWVKPACA
jgi:hypothetical protein